MSSNKKPPKSNSSKTSSSKKHYKPKRKNNSRRKKPRPEETKHLTNSLSVFGLPDPYAKTQDEDKKRGPPQPQSLRKHGDPELAELLAEALSKSGHVDRGTHSFHTYPADASRYGKNHHLRTSWRCSRPILWRGNGFD